MKLTRFVNWQKTANEIKHTEQQTCHCVLQRIWLTTDATMCKKIWATNYTDITHRKFARDYWICSVSVDILWHFHAALLGILKYCQGSCLQCEGCRSSSLVIDKTNYLPIIDSRYFPIGTTVLFDSLSCRLQVWQMIISVNCKWCWLRHYTKPGAQLWILKTTSIVPWPSKEHQTKESGK